MYWLHWLVWFCVIGLLELTSEDRIIFFRCFDMKNLCHSVVYCPYFADVLYSVSFVKYIYLFGLRAVH